MKAAQTQTHLPTEVWQTIFDAIPDAVDRYAAYASFCQTCTMAKAQVSYIDPLRWLDGITPANLHRIAAHDGRTAMDYVIRNAAPKISKATLAECIASAGMRGHTETIAAIFHASPDLRHLPYNMITTVLLPIIRADQVEVIKLLLTKWTVECFNTEAAWREIVKSNSTNIYSYLCDTQIDDECQQFVDILKCALVATITEDKLSLLEALLDRYRAVILTRFSSLHHKVVVEAAALMPTTAALATLFSWAYAHDRNLPVYRADYVFPKHTVALIRACLSKSSVSLLQLVMDRENYDACKFLLEVPTFPAKVSERDVLNAVKFRMYDIAALLITHCDLCRISIMNIMNVVTKKAKFTPAEKVDAIVVLLSDKLKRTLFK